MMRAALYGALGFLAGCDNITRGVGYRGERQTFDYQRTEARRAFDQGDYGEALVLAEGAYAIRADDRELNHILASTHMAVIGMDPAGIVAYVEEITKPLDANASAEDPSSDTAMGRLLSKTQDFDSLIVLSDDVKAALSAPVGEGGAVAGRSAHPIFAGLDLPVPKNIATARQEERRYLAHLNRTIELACAYVDPSVRIIAASGHEVEDARHTRSACSTAHTTALEGDFHYLWVVAHLVEGTILTRYLAPNMNILAKRFEALVNARSSLDPDTALELIRETLVFVNTVYPTNDAIAADSMVAAILNDAVSALEAYREILGVDPSASVGLGQVLDMIKQQRTPYGNDPDALRNAALQSAFKALVAYFGPDLTVAGRRTICRLLVDALSELDEDQCVADFYNLGKS